MSLGEEHMRADLQDQWGMFAWMLEHLVQLIGLDQAGGWDRSGVLDGNRRLKLGLRVCGGDAENSHQDEMRALWCATAIHNKKNLMDQ
jgi:hypothetical protein